ncbi:Penicillin-binding protein 4 [Colletotrichum trifolii]|uniref:Penicillin-binding protein 4 n=1 Tax=Colletotrichum trifolii TaxID=5466 RepID=A0A4V3HUQ2_COLTR|nr:Penicillin-binding protein 4 [Colletotrichum trifolii]
MRSTALVAVPLLATLLVARDEAQQPLASGQLGDDETRAISYDRDQYIEKIMKDWHVPGLAVAVVNGNDTWSKGYGYATLNTTPVTPHTLFYAGSTTKSFTAAGISLLVDNSTFPDLTWTTPVSSVLRDDFVLSDTWATAHITLEDVLSHRTGYPRHDLASALTARETTRMLRHLPMSAEPRARFQYCNKMFGVMGHLIETLTGEWLGDFFRARLWEPMGMNETYFSLADAENSVLDLASEYFYDYTGGKHYPVPHKPRSGEEGAGSIISNVLDYAKYLRVMMNEEDPISASGHRELKTPRSLYAISQRPFTGPLTYGLGWVAGVLGGEVVYFHSGQVTEHVSMMMMIPARKVAVSVMSNTESLAASLIALHILYEKLGIPEDKRDDLDLNDKWKRDRKTQQKQRENCDKDIYPSAPHPPMLPSVPLADHTGEYANPGYGKVTVDLYCPDAVSMLRGPRGSRDRGCQLRVLGVAGAAIDYLKLMVYLAPKSGNYWVGRAYIEAGDVRQVDTPAWCMRAEFEIDVSGGVKRFRLDVRLEGDNVPLVWFDRVDN